MGTRSGIDPRWLTGWFALCCVLSCRYGLGQVSEAVSVPLLYPSAMVYDAAGVLYVAETNRHVIDRIDTAGVLSVVAGDGTQGFAGDGGAATSAELDSPQGLALDAAGNLYVADTRNHRVRLVAAVSGVITTVAGTGTAGFSGDGGLGTVAQLRAPTGLALDGAGNLFIADSGNHRVRRVVLASGAISTFAGSGVQGNSGDLGAAQNALLDSPGGLACDASGNLWIADSRNGRVRKVDAVSGVISGVTASDLIRPSGLSTDAAGNLFIADVRGQRIFRLALDGSVSAVAGQGAQGFSGDGGAASLAMLDSPRGTGVSPAGLLTLTDTANERVRQVDAAGVIRTIGGVEAFVPGALTLSAPSVVQYGTGSVSAGFSSGTPASGFLSFFEVSGNAPASLGTVALVGGSVGFDTSGLAAGGYRIQATYAGDGTQGSAQSNVLSLTVRTAPVTATVVAPVVVYGQAIPPLTGTVSGVLARDAGLVSAAFSTAAAGLAPAGNYPISATLTGAAAANYQLASDAAGTLVIGRAGTTTTAAAADATVVQGSPAVLSARVLSTTRGVPTGQVGFLDGGSSVGSAAVDAQGEVALTTLLAAGTHTLTASYAGDANFTGSVSAPIAEAVTAPATPAQNFSLSSLGAATQTAASGASVSFSFGVAVQNGPLDGPILLSVSGLPLGASSTFTPSLLPPGGSVSNFTLTVQTAKTQAKATSGSAVLWVGMLAVLGTISGKRRRWGLSLLLIPGVFLLQGCGDRQFPDAATTVNAKSSPMLVTGTSTLASGVVLQRTASITLSLQ